MLKQKDSFEFVVNLATILQHKHQPTPPFSSLSPSPSISPSISPSTTRHMKSLLLLTLPAVATSYCWSCENAPSRSWSWWFGFGSCNCESDWSGSCCGSWSVSDWDKKISEWSKGESCEAQPEQACKKVSNSPPEYQVDSNLLEWEYEPSSHTSQRQCENANCIWVECFKASSGARLSNTDPDTLCSHCDGPWEGKCEWNSYEPGPLAFAGPGKNCGFQYPKCEADKGENCFCGSATQEIKEGWCNSGRGQDKFCPRALDHGDGRTQECVWSGWTISPQVNGGIDASCSAWGIPMTDDPVVPEAKAVVAQHFVKSEPGATVVGSEMSLGSAVLLVLGAGVMKKRKLTMLKGGAAGEKGVQMLPKQTVSVV